MFDFFKKRKVGAQDATHARTDVEQPVDHDSLVAQADALVSRIESAEGKDKAALLDKRGELLAKAGEADTAIAAFEQSIATHLQMGKAYRGLTSLYNMKRREAAEAGDDAAMKLYFDKLQDLMQSSKDMLRGK